MKHFLSFAQINVLNDNIIEVIVNKDVEISIEMVEEYDEFLSHHFNRPIGILINKINPYHYSFEAQFLAGSNENIIAMAAVYYDKSSADEIMKMKSVRSVDQLNVQAFNALEMGWQDAKQWLEHEVALVTR